MAGFMAAAEKVFLSAKKWQTCNSSSFTLLLSKMAPVKSTVVKKQKFIIDCSAPANDKIFDVAAFVSRPIVTVLLVDPCPYSFYRRSSFMTVSRLKAVPTTWVMLLSSPALVITRSPLLPTLLSPSAT